MEEIIIDSEKDYGFYRLIEYIKDIKYGEITMRIRGGKPYQIVKSEKSMLLIKDTKNKEDYGD